MNCCIDVLSEDIIENRLKLIGDIVGYKAAFIIVKDRTFSRYNLKPHYCLKPVIVKLQIPKGVYATPGQIDALTEFGEYPYRKRRCSNAIVQEILSSDMKYQYKRAIGHSYYDNDFIYRIGEVVEPKNGFDFNPAKTCCSGIHFFNSIEEAQRFNRDNWIFVEMAQTRLARYYEQDLKSKKAWYNSDGK